MAKEFGFFPDETYGPDDFTTYFRDFYSNGIMADDTSYFAVTEQNGMSLAAKKGIAYIDGHFYRPPLDAIITLDDSDTEYPRIDLVVIKCDYVKKEIYIDVVTGEPLAEPQIPEMERDAAAYCLGLAAITVAANTSEITQADIKDLRFDENYCGVVVGKINTISTAALFAQYEAQWELLKAGCAQDAEAVIAAWNALSNVKSINGKVGEVLLTQSDIPSDGTAYQFPYFIQSGSVAINYSSTTSPAQISVTFPVSFKSEPILLLSSSKGTSTNGLITPVTINHKDLSNQGFTLMPWTGTSYTMKNTIANWVAMGIIDI